MQKKNLFGLCPYVTSQKVLTGKWSMYIMYLLTDGPIRFNELQRKMPEEMTHTTLSRQLKKLEEEGLIERIEYQQIPPKVEYKLSNIGENANYAQTECQFRYCGTAIPFLTVRSTAR